MAKARLVMTVAALGLIAACGRRAPESKYGVEVRGGPMDSVLLKDYRPESSLVVPRTKVEKANEELLATRDRLLERHRRTKFIFCHFSNQGHDTAALGRALDRYPNLYVDLAARDYEIGRQPRTMRAFLERYRGRVLFGTDMGRDRQMYEGWWRLLETGDEFLAGRLWWPYYGLELPDAALRSIYRDAAREVLGLP